MKIRFACFTAAVAVLFLVAPARAAKVTICHVPPGNPNNSHVISVSEDAVQAHLAHGDSLGTCVVTCPCADATDSPFAQALDGQIPVLGCLLSPTAGVALVTADSFSEAFTLELNGQWFCGFVLPEDLLPITPAQGQYCTQLLQQTANGLGLTCEPL